MVVIQDYYTKATNDNDMTYYYNYDHYYNSNNNNKKEIKKKEATGVSCVHIMCDKVLLDYSVLFLPVWSSVNNTKLILSNASLF